jgi:hypothetical protein
MVADREVISVTTLRIDCYSKSNFSLAGDSPGTLNLSPRRSIRYSAIYHEARIPTGPFGRSQDESCAPASITKYSCLLPALG